MFQSHDMDTISDDDDLVDRSLDVDQGISDDENENSQGDQSSHRADQRQADVISVSSDDEEQDDKENEPILGDDLEQMNATEELPNVLASPSRAVGPQFPWCFS